MAMVRSMSTLVVLVSSLRTASQTCNAFHIKPIHSPYLRQISSISKKWSRVFNMNSSNGNVDEEETTVTQIKTPEATPPPTHIAEGLCAVYKPLEWTSNDVVMKIRGILEKDARNRGVKLAKRRSKSKNKIKVGHGGTLDPLASGVLVLGIGSGTKDLQKYLSGSKKYRAGCELGFETETLDMEHGRENVTSTKPFDHVTNDLIGKIIPQFTGSIMQKPPIYSAIRKNGKRLYEHARAGELVKDDEIEAREVQIYNLEFLEEGSLPCFGLNIECGGGTYIRSLVRDMGRALDTCATMTSLERTQQGRFTLQDAIPKDEWSAENIYAAVKRSNAILGALNGGEEENAKK